MFYIVPCLSVTVHRVAFGNKTLESNAGASEVSLVTTPCRQQHLCQSTWQLYLPPPLPAARGLTLLKENWICLDVRFPCTLKPLPNDYFACLNNTLRNLRHAYLQDGAHVRYKSLRSVSIQVASALFGTQYALYLQFPSLFSRPLGFELQARTPSHTGWPSLQVSAVTDSPPHLQQMKFWTPLGYFPGQSLSPRSSLLRSCTALHSILRVSTGFPWNHCGTNGLTIARSFLRTFPRWNGCLHCFYLRANPASHHGSLLLHSSSPS